MKHYEKKNSGKKIIRRALRQDHGRSMITVSPPHTSNKQNASLNVPHVPTPCGSLSLVREHHWPDATHVTAVTSHYWSRTRAPSSPLAIIWLSHMLLLAAQKQTQTITTKALFLFSLSSFDSLLVDALVEPFYPHIHTIWCSFCPARCWPTCAPRRRSME